MTPIEKAIAQLGGQTATARIFGVSPQATQQWSAQGRVPADYCPRIEHLLAGAVRCEELNDRVEWELIRGAYLPGKSSGNSTIDHAAELRGAIAQTRLVFEGHRDAQDALEYLERVLKAGQRAEVPAHACTPAPGDSRGVDVMLDTPACKSAPPRDNSALAQIKRELFTTADQLQQPADLVVQMLVLAELRGMRAESIKYSSAVE